MMTDMLQLDLFGVATVLPRHLRRRDPAWLVSMSGRALLKYQNRRPRRCAWCSSWFRPPTSVLPEHYAGGVTCPGGGQRERGPLAVPVDPEWRRQAACRVAPQPQLFWVTNDHAVILKALTFCQRCPVLENCFEWAIQEKHFTGVAGGMVVTSRLRGQILRERNDLAAEGSDAANN